MCWKLWQCWSCCTLFGYKLKKKVSKTCFLKCADTIKVTLEYESYVLPTFLLKMFTSFFFPKHSPKFLTFSEKEKNIKRNCSDSDHIHWPETEQPNSVEDLQAV